MKKTLSIVAIVIGILLIFWGLLVSASFAAEAERVLSTSTKVLIVGAALVCGGLVVLARSVTE
ncbi:MAG TPA: hypothetical protein VL793_00805 [Patescibacteria group bacterium]|nr:hypothetical protein [Patescibacteria group bacterium]